MTKNLFTIVDDLIAGLRELRGRIEPLEKIAALLPGFASAAPAKRRRRRRGRKSAPAAPTAPAAKAKKPASRKASIARKQQGHYMVAVRRLNVPQKAQVAAVRKEKGFDAAMKLAGSFAK